MFWEDCILQDTYSFSGSMLVWAKGEFVVRVSSFVVKQNILDPKAQTFFVMLSDGASRASRVRHGLRKLPGDSIYWCDPKCFQTDFLETA